MAREAQNRRSGRPQAWQIGYCAVAQLERALISERTKAGIIAARSKGRLAGNPGSRERKLEALAKMTAVQQAIRTRIHGSGVTITGERSVGAA